MKKSERYLQIVITKAFWAMAGLIVLLGILYILPRPTFTVHSFDTTQDKYAVGETIITNMQFTSYDGQRIREDVSVKCGEDYYPIRMVSYTSSAAKNAKTTIPQGAVPEAIAVAIGEPESEIQCKLNVVMHVTYRVAAVMDRTVSKYFSSNNFDVTK